MGWWKIMGGLLEEVIAELILKDKTPQPDERSRRGKMEGTERWGMTSSSEWPQYVTQWREWQNTRLPMHIVALIQSRTYYVPGNVLCGECITSMNEEMVSGSADDTAGKCTDWRRRCCSRGRGGAYYALGWACKRLLNKRSIQRETRRMSGVLPKERQGKEIPKRGNRKCKNQKTKRGRHNLWTKEYRRTDCEART